VSGPTRHAKATALSLFISHLHEIVVVVPTINMTAGGRKNSDMNVVHSASLDGTDFEHWFEMQ
jgi:hypothetical protein